MDQDKNIKRIKLNRSKFFSSEHTKTLNDDPKKDKLQPNISNNVSHSLSNESELKNTFDKTKSDVTSFVVASSFSSSNESSEDINLNESKFDVTLFKTILSNSSMDETLKITESLSKSITIDSVVSSTSSTVESANTTYSKRNNSDTVSFTVVSSTSSSTSTSEVSISNDFSESGNKCTTSVLNQSTEVPTKIDDISTQRFQEEQVSCDSIYNSFISKHADPDNKIEDDVEVHEVSNFLIEEMEESIEPTGISVNKESESEFYVMEESIEVNDSKQLGNFCIEEVEESIEHIETVNKLNFEEKKNEIKLYDTDKLYIDDKKVVEIESVIEENQTEIEDEDNIELNDSSTFCTDKKEFEKVESVKENQTQIENENNIDLSEVNESKHEEVTEIQTEENAEDKQIVNINNESVTETETVTDIFGKQNQIENMNKLNFLKENDETNSLIRTTISNDKGLTELVDDSISADEDIFEDAVETIETASMHDSKIVSSTVSIPEKFAITETAKNDTTNTKLEMKNNHDTVTSESVANISKLEQALTKTVTADQLISADLLKERFLGEQFSETTDNDEMKEKIKLHLSLQGDKISIKQSPSIPTGSSSAEPVRIKRKYTKRKHLIDGKKIDDNSKYKLRARDLKKTILTLSKRGRKEAGRTVTRFIIPGSNQSVLLSKETIASLNDTVNSSDLNSNTEISVGGKIQPIKLKISKNANFTIQCSSSCNTNKKTDKMENILSNKFENIVEETRKKNTSVLNYREQAANAWSGPDLERVERLLKESNITITPVASSRDATQHSTPKSVDMKEKSISNIFSPSAIATITPIVSDNSTKDTDSFRDMNVHLKPLDMEEQIQGWKIPRTSSNVDVISAISSNSKMIDVKSEIRKMIATAEKRKQETKNTDFDSLIEQKLKANKALPDLVPINFHTGIPEIMSPDTTSTENESNSEQVISEKLPPVFSSPILQMMSLPFPKKRGRPTKAMVAARNAYRQSQEALEQFRKLQAENYAKSQPTENEENTPPHFPIPLFDITEPSNVDKTPQTIPLKAKRGRKPKSEKLLMLKSAAETKYVEKVIEDDPVKKEEEMKRLEEERIRKEEERERRNEIRRQKAKERNDLVKAKRLRQKMKAEERQKRMQEKRRRLQEEKKKLEEEIKNLPASLTSFDEALSNNNNQSQNLSFNKILVDDESNSALNDTTQRIKKSRMEVTDIDNKELTADQIAEYQWPIQGGDLYMIQEQVSNYLGVKSFKRKYPDIKRRPVDSEERAYLVDSGLVSESLCDLGLTAVCSAEVLDVMCSDFPDKYEELRKYMREKQMKELTFKQKAWANGLGYKLLMADGSKQDLKKRAMESASNWNSALNKSRTEDRRCAMDLQTFIVHYPKIKSHNISMSAPKIGSYPISILPGQFSDYFKEYTSTELKYMPINTVLYGPLKHPELLNGADFSQTDSDNSSSSDDSSSTTSEDTQIIGDTLQDIEKDLNMDHQLQNEKLNNEFIQKKEMKNEKCEVNEIIEEDVEDADKCIDTKFLVPTTDKLILKQENIQLVDK